MIRISLFFIITIFALNFAKANMEEPLPIAPKRSDDRDSLPTMPFVSLTGQDPFLPETDESGKRAVANTIDSKSSKKPNAKSKVPPKTPSKAEAKSSLKKTAKKPAKAKSVVSNQSQAKTKSNTAKQQTTTRKPAQTNTKKKTK